MTQRPLASYLTRLILLSILPLVVLTAWWAFDSVRERGEATREEASQLAHNAASLIDQYLDARIRALSMLSASPLADDLAGWRRLYAEAQGFQRSFGSHVIMEWSAPPTYASG